MAMILVVDENPVERRVMRMTLEMDGHRIAEAPNGNEALKIIEQYDMDLVVVAMDMQELDGYRLITQARTFAGRENVQFVAVLEAADEKGPVESFIAGATDLLIRPFGAPELRLAVERTTSPEQIGLRQRLVGAQLEAYETAVRLQEQARG
jgi:PleD family two-component response regulator